MPLSIAPILACALAVAVAGLAGEAAAQCISGAGPDGAWVRHQTGFALTGLDGMVVACGEQGIAVTDPGQPMRTSGPATARVLDAPPDGDWPGAHPLADGTDARFRVDVFAGGSGGTEYILTAWRPLADGILVVEQNRQFEPGFWSDPPDDAWSLVWALMEGARAEAD